MVDKNLLTDLKKLGGRVHQPIEPVASSSLSAPDRAAFVYMLNEALATELVCALRYRCHFFLADAAGATSLADLFRRFADEELRVAQQLSDAGIDPADPAFAPHFETVSHARGELDTILSELEESAQAFQAATAGADFINEDHPAFPTFQELQNTLNTLQDNIDGINVRCQAAADAIAAEVTARS